MLKVGSRAEVIDNNSEFYGLVVIIMDITTEPKPRPFTVYKVKTEDGNPPKNYPFSKASFRAEQLKSI